MNSKYISLLLMLLVESMTACIGQNPCENTNCGTVCRECDLWEQTCVNGECVDHQLIEENSEECGYDPCTDITCETECFGTELWKMVCQEGKCVQDSLIERDSTECGYMPLLEGEISEEEFLVYNAYIEEAFSEKTIVILDHTFWGVCGVGAYGCTTFSFSLSEDMPELQPETYDDFEAVNEGPYALKDLFDVSKEIVLISEEKLLRIFDEGGGGWEEFYDLYPSSQGVLLLSRVGFNADMTQAFFYAGNQSHGLSGAGYYILLVKEKGEWVVQDQVMIWIS
jgi:hypothetical protein